MPRCSEQEGRLLQDSTPETGVLSTLNGGHLKMGVPLVVVCSVDSWDLGEKKTNFYFLDYKFVILGIVAFV